jgi:hypothetical protein
VIVAMGFVGYFVYQVAMTYGPGISKPPAKPVQAPAPPPTAPETPVPAAAPAPAAVPAAEPRPPRQDRWQDIKGALARCRRESLISRVVCEQRVLFLCDGYWGKVPQCPDAQNPDPGK